MNKSYAINDSIINPFWDNSFSEKNLGKVLIKKIFKHLFRILKLILYLFLTVMGLWGCIQFMAEPWTNTSPNLGEGLEFGYSYGSTGDWRFDLQSDGSSPYFVYTDFSFDYGPFYAFFVWPFVQITLPLMWSMHSWNGYGGFDALITIFILLLVIRSITIVFSLNATLMSEKMTEVSGQIAEINAKYKNLVDPNSKRMKQLETMAIYKKNNVKPNAVLAQAFVTIPIFLVILRIINSLRPIKTTVLFGIWDLSLTPFTEIFQHFTDGGWLYVFFLLLVIPMQFASLKIPQMWAQKRNINAKTFSNKGEEQLKKNRRTQLIISCVFMVFAVVSACGVGLYWFLNAIFTLTQSYILHVMIIKRRKKLGQKSKLSRIIDI